MAKSFHWIVAALTALMFITIAIREETERGTTMRDTIALMVITT